MRMDYYLLEVLPDEVRQQNGIKSRTRLDLTRFYTQTPYEGLQAFQNAKGMIYLGLCPCRDMIEANAKRRAEYCLSDGKKNLSSIYVENFEVPQCAYGYPNGRPKLKNGEPNPLFPYRLDAYLFKVNDDYSKIELMVLQGERAHIGHHYQRFYEGEYDRQIEALRAESKIFYPYIGYGDA
jgi:hypothetical protein